MRSGFLELDQTLHGYDNGHRLLAASLPLEPRDERALLSMSDLSGPRAVENFLDYLTGYMLPGGSHYAIAKTWYASEMERPGCVWTHTFLIPRESIQEIRALHFIQNKFFRPRLRSGYRYAERIAVSANDLVENDHAGLSEPIDESVLCGIEALYSSDDSMVVLLAKSGSQYEELSLRLWSQLWADVRPEFSFCTGSLSKRNLQGKPLVLQFGPDRIVRDMRNRTFDQCSPSIWVRALAQDLKQETSLRDFLAKNGPGLRSLSDTSRLVRIFLCINKGDAVGAIALLSPNDFVSAIQLVRTVYQYAESHVPSLTFLKMVLMPGTLNSLVSREMLTRTIRRSLDTARTETVALLAEVLQQLEMRGYNIVISALAEYADVDFVVSLSDTNPDLYQAILGKRIDLCYEPSLWSSSLPLLDKMDLFDVVREHVGINKRRLYKAILDSQDADLSSEVVTHLGEIELPGTLEWLIEGDWTIALRPQWTSYLKRYQDEVLSWVESHESSQISILILANVIDFRPAMDLGLSTSKVMELASLADPLIKERHEVAAFVYVTTTHVPNPAAATHCFAAFAILHAAIAQSRLSNRAWQILEHNLLPLPFEQWDACEKLRRALLHFTFLHKWPIDDLWNVVSASTNLFHDFIRTAKSFDLGQSFFSMVRDKAVRGEFNVSKQQYKEIRKLLR